MKGNNFCCCEAVLTLQTKKQLVKSERKNNGVIEKDVDTNALKSIVVESIV